MEYETRSLLKNKSKYSESQIYQICGTPLHVSYAPAQLLAHIYPDRFGKINSTSNVALKPSTENHEETNFIIANESKTEDKQNNDKVTINYVDRWTTITSYILEQWTGRKEALPISYAEASWTGMFDFRNFKWSEEMLDVLNNIYAAEVEEDRNEVDETKQSEKEEKKRNSLT